MTIKRLMTVALAAAFAVTAAAAENKDGKKFNLGLEKIQLILGEYSIGKVVSLLTLIILKHNSGIRCKHITVHLDRV